MEKGLLLANLKRVAPALTRRDFLPVLACFCFTGDRVFAYDDTVALETPCKTDFEGALNGKVLMDLLSASKAKEVDIQVGEQEVKLKIGRTLAKLPFLTSEGFVFKMPSSKKQVVVEVKGTAFIPALKAAMTSMGFDPSQAWCLGVTASFGKQLDLYSSDNFTMSRATCPVKGGNPGDSIILPPKFCELLVSLNSRDRVKTLTYCIEGGTKWVKATFESGTVLFSKAILQDNLTAFYEVEKTAPGGGLVEIPAGFARCLERSCALLSSAQDKHGEVKIVDGVLRLKTTTPMGQIIDKIKVPGHEDVELRVAPPFLHRVLEFCSEIRFTKQMVELSGGGEKFKFRHYVCSVVVE